jgi:CRP/FNR family transcriptional regulator, cyclic AMP receptor protein
VDWHLLSGLPEDDRRRVIAAMGRHRYGQGEVVFNEGDPADAVHFIAQGRLIVRRTTPSGERAAFTVMGPGEAFGELAMLSPTRRRSSTVEALEAAVTLTLDFVAFRRLSEDYPRVNQLLVDLLAARVQRLSDHLLDALYAPVEERVARRLADLCRIYRSPSGQSDLPVVLPVTQTELAEMAGASRPATNRVLRALAGRDAVRLARGRIAVLDASLLDALAGS